MQLTVEHIIEQVSSLTPDREYGYVNPSNKDLLKNKSLVPQLAEYVFVGQSTIGTSLFKLETPYADPHVWCCERCDAKTSAYSIKTGCFIH